MYLIRRIRDVTTGMSPAPRNGGTSDDELSAGSSGDEEHGSSPISSHSGASPQSERIGMGDESSLQPSRSATNKNHHDNQAGYIVGRSAQAGLINHVRGSSPILDDPELEKNRLLLAELETTHLFSIAGDGAGTGNGPGSLPFISGDSVEAAVEHSEHTNLKKSIAEDSSYDDIISLFSSLESSNSSLGIQSDNRSEENQGSTGDDCMQLPIMWSRDLGAISEDPERDTTSTLLTTQDFIEQQPANLPIPSSIFPGWDRRRINPEDENQRLRYMVLESFNETFKAQREYGKIQEKLQKTQEKLDSVLLVLAQRLGEQHREWNSFVKGKAGSTALTSSKLVGGGPVADPFRVVKGQKAKPGRRFLYNTLSEQLLEMLISLKIAQVRVLLAKREPARAQAIAMLAMESAEKLRYAPLIGRCWFWVGVAQFKGGDYIPSVESFKMAKTFLEECEMYAEERLALDGNHALAQKKVGKEQMIRSWID